MAILRVEHNKKNPYFMLNRAACNDERLSMKALGMHTYLMSRPDNWEIKEEHLVSTHKDGRVAVRSALKELKMCGYIESRPIRDEKKRIIRWERIIYETPLHPIDPDDKDYDAKLEALKLQDQSYITQNLQCSKTQPTNAKATLHKTCNVGPSTLINNDLITNEKENKEKRIQSPAPRSDNARKAPSASLGGGRMKGFVDIEKPDTPPQDKHAIQISRRLAEGLSKKGKLTRSVNISKWTSQVEDWILETNIEPSRILKVLDWYLENINNEFMPEAYSANTFRDKFPRIESAKRRSTKMSMEDRNKQTLEIVRKRREERANA